MVGVEAPSSIVHLTPAALIVVGGEEGVALADAAVDAAEVVAAVGVELECAVRDLAGVASVHVACRDAVDRAVEECSVLTGGGIVPYVHA